jgi:GAF domain-containing protein
MGTLFHNIPKGATAGGDADMSFDLSLESCTTVDQTWALLHHHTGQIVGAKLFTVTIMDMAQLVHRRVYTNDPVAYPLSGTKPIVFDRWFDLVQGERKMFVANTIAEIADIFPDHQQILALGLQSVVNVPVIFNDELVATINLLHERNFYSEEKLNLISANLPDLACRAYIHAKRLELPDSKKMSGMLA